MKPSFTLRLVPAALIGLWAGTAGASGFQLLEQNASGLGNAYAGSAAVAENASTIYFNPAGMTLLDGKNVSVGVNVINPSYKFSNGSSSVGALGAAGNGGDAGSLGAVPNGYFSMALTKDLFVGLGIGAPFGLKTEYDNPWIGGAQSLKFDVKTLNINPSIAYKVNEKVSVGFGLNWQRMEAEYVRLAGIISAPYPLSASTVRLNVDDDKWGWNAGALFTISPTTKVGVSYRSAIKHKLSGSISMSGPSAALNAANSGSASAEIELPATFIVSATQGLDDRWEMLGDISWTGWSSIDKVDVMRSGVANPVQTLDTKFRDTWRVALGANYKYSDAWKLKFGVAYDQTPVRDAEHRLVSLPDNNRFWLSTGAQWKPNKESAVDLGLAYLIIKDASINNNQTNPATSTYRGLVNGTYSGSIWIIGAQYSMQF